MADTQNESMNITRNGSQGSWTGQVADMQMLNSLKHKTSPAYFLEQYPRHRASSLNTWLCRFGIYSNGIFFELDRKGSDLVKQAIKKSANNRGYLMRVTGIRRGYKITVSGVAEVLTTPASSEANTLDSSRMRGQFATMGI